MMKPCVIERDLRQHTLRATREELAPTVSINAGCKQGRISPLIINILSELTRLNADVNMSMRALRARRMAPLTPQSDR